MKWVDVIGTAKAVPSHPARGAWIEILGCARKACKRSVAPRKGCVD